MKKGIAIIAAVWLDCPHCGGSVSQEDGSLLVAWNNSDKLVCDDCGEEVKLPKTTRRKKS